ncbi:MAG: restriction endonuclease subunit S [Uliginosibacterium sp.]|nr:restriction endonuclease subunit S [Uliginosibacterium sp.]
MASLEYGKSIRDYQNATGEYPVYGTNGPIGWHHTPLCPSAGVIIGRKGAYRGIHYSKKPFFVIDTAFYLKPKVELDTKWTYYCLLTYDINGMDSGSAIPSTSRDEFYQLPVRVPSLDEQRRIAEMLGTLDDRIALLRETNATLEAIAQALFKSWFVDFDPVHARARGEQPEGLPEPLAALFPDSFEESPLGLVPRGWRVEPLSDVMDFKEGPGIRNWQYTNSDEGTRFINIRCIQDGDLTIETANRISDEEANGKYAHFHLASWDVVVSTSGTLGRSAIVREEHLR